MNHTIHTAIRNWKTQFESNPGKYTVDYISDSLIKAFADITINVEVQITELTRFPGMTNDMYAIGGTFVPDQLTEFTINIILPKYLIKHGIDIDEQWLKGFVRELTQVSIHEYRHYEQDCLRGHNPVITEYLQGKTPKEKYLGNTDEIDAYAESIAFFLYDKFGKEEAFKILNNPPTIIFSGCDDLYEYMKTFGESTKHKIIRKLFKKIMRNLNGY